MVCMQRLINDGDDDCDDDDDDDDDESRRQNSSRVRKIERFGRGSLQP